MRERMPRAIFYFVDRKKDAIRRRGENISSAEVEALLNRHPAILESAVIAVPSEFGEDDVKAVVVLKEGARITAEELWAFCDEHMPRFWVPRYIEFRQEMPKTPSQKIQKYLLRHDSSLGEVFDREKPSRSPEALYLRKRYAIQGFRRPARLLPVEDLAKVLRAIGICGSFGSRLRHLLSELDSNIAPRSAACAHRRKPKAPLRLSYRLLQDHDGLGVVLA